MTTTTETPAVGQRPSDPGGSWSNPWQRLAGTIVFAYLVETSVSYGLASLSATEYRRWLRWQGELPFRVLGCLVVVAVVTHAVLGLRTVLLERVPSLRRRAEIVTAVASFVVVATSLPLCAIVLRPWLQAHVL